MKILLIYPQYPDSFWSFKHALKFISKKAAVPPLGLITVSAMLPKTWQKKLLDLNVSELDEKEIEWADYVFISAMYIQKESVNKVISACIKLGAKIVAGGPLFTQEYNTEKFADLSLSPIPDFHLLQIKKYAFMSIQISRGCPFSCDFCEITSLLGHKVRLKKTSQIIHELDALYRLNWRGSVSIVDDNFIGNKKEIKSGLLPSLKSWMEKHKFPFAFNIQSSINLADDEELMSLMVETGFTSTFIGIETPDDISLQTCNKVQNQNRDLLQSIIKIQNTGMQVSGGFIVGFDSDTSSVFERQIDFIQKSGIVSAMVGLLNAPQNTILYKKLEAENRLTNEATGNNTDSSINFVPKMEYMELMNGYRKIIDTVYATKPYYQRIRQLFQNYNRRYKKRNRINFTLIKAFLKSMFVIGIVNKGRLEYWKLLIWTLIKKPGLFADAVTFSVYGYHFRTVYGLRQKFSNV